eukprot:3752485-Amphidinium_carterae.1
MDQNRFNEYDDRKLSFATFHVLDPFLLVPQEQGELCTIIVGRPKEQRKLLRFKARFEKGSAKNASENP